MMPIYASNVRLSARDDGFTPLQPRCPVFQDGKKRGIQKVYRRLRPSGRVVTGFTIVEMVIIVSILLLISSTIFANFPSLYQRIGLQRSTQRLALALRRTQNMALGVRQIPTVPPRIPPAFGVYIGPKIPAGSYAVFADLHPPGNPNSAYDPDPGKDFLLEQSEFEPGIVVSSLVFPSGSGSETSVTFSVPAGAAKIIKGGAGSAEENSMEIVLISPDGQTRRVVVKNTGQMYTK